MKKIVIICCTFLMASLLINCTSSRDHKNKTEQIYSVADLLENPIYDKKICISGVISELGIRNSMSFQFNSGGKSINVWYGMMVNDDRKAEPTVDISKFKNKTFVLITGKLKNKGKYVLKNHFWISSIQKQ
jgi:hypothetical protein